MIAYFSFSIYPYLKNQENNYNIMGKIEKIKKKYNELKKAAYDQIKN